jgi:hypothetical protein
LEYLWRPLISTLLLFLPTVAGWSVLYGMGVPLTFGSGNNSESVSILDLIDTDDRFWLWPVAVIALLIVTGIYSARRSPIAPNGRPIGWWLAAVLPAALFVLSLSASLSANSSGFERASIGFDLLFVLLLGAVYGIGAGMLGTFLVPRRPPMVMAGYPPAGYPPPGYPPAGFPPPPAFPTPPPSYPAPPTFGTPMPGFQPPPGYAQAAPSSPPAPTAPSTWSSPAPPPIPDPAPPSEPPTGVTPPPPSFPAAPPRED